MDNSPRRIIALIRSGFKEPVLKANTYWYCASCYQCTVRCPRGIDIAELMYGLKRYTVWKDPAPGRADRTGVFPRRL
jgi:heterodisulfide reductase subunit C